MKRALSFTFVLVAVVVQAQTTDELQARIRELEQLALSAGGQSEACEARYQQFSRERNVPLNPALTVMPKLTVDEHEEFVTFKWNVTIINAEPTQQKFDLAVRFYDTNDYVLDKWWDCEDFIDGYGQRVIVGERLIPMARAKQLGGATPVRIGIVAR
jgi:hypothetical protein